MSTGRCALAFGAAMYGAVFRPAKTADTVTEAIPIAVPTYPSQDLENFVIPFDREDNDYMSLSISLRSTDGAVLNELGRKKEILRGRLYDLLKAHADQATGHPTLAGIKEIVYNGVNAWLSAGRVEGVYITQFIIK